jgi:DNA-binding NarL/FixJ family response regulator
LLRLAQAEVDTADASIRAALAATATDTVGRCRLLPAAVEVALAAGDLPSAEAWSDELTAAAERYGTARLVADARHARGAVLLHGAPATAVPVLREALRAFQELDAVYDLARVRLLLAHAGEQLDDTDSAALERDAAASLFARLGIGVAPHGGGAGRPSHHRDPAGLTRREREILGLVAEGRSNQEIATELVLSIRTVERHLATTYQKLGVHGRSARAAAVSHALRTGIVDT